MRTDEVLAIIEQSREMVEDIRKKVEELRAECDRKDAEIAALKDAAIQGDGYHKKYSGCLKELDDKDSENAMLRKALELACTELESEGCNPTNEEMQQASVVRERYIQQAREALK